MAKVWAILFVTIWLVGQSSAWDNSWRYQTDTTTRITPRPSCSRSAGSYSMCQYRSTMCGDYISYSPDGGNRAWESDHNVYLGYRLEIQKQSWWYEGNFTYLDTMDFDAPLGTRIRLRRKVPNRSAMMICAEFKYATLSERGEMPTIKVYNEVVNGPDLLIGEIEEDTRGQWRTAELHFCLQPNSSISFEGKTTHTQTIVAIDDAVLYFTPHKDMTCPEYVTPTNEIASNTATLKRPQSRESRPNTLGMNGGVAGACQQAGWWIQDHPPVRGAHQIVGSRKKVEGCQAKWSEAAIRNYLTSFVVPAVSEGRPIRQEPKQHRYKTGGCHNMTSSTKTLSAV